MMQRLKTQCKSKTFRSRLKKKITSTSFLSLFPNFFGLGIISFGQLIGGWIYGNISSIPEKYTAIWMLLGFLIASISGIVIIVRKEAPRIGRPNIKGWFAVAIGIMWTCMMISVVIGILIDMFS